MARETKAEFAARVARDNADAKTVLPGTKHTDSILGTVFTLVGPAEGQLDGWDLYTVHNSNIIPGGANISMTSAVVAAAFVRK
jgi:hypothetical protein